jgi:hypothetical protein
MASAYSLRGQIINLHRLAAPKVTAAWTGVQQGGPVFAKNAILIRSLPATEIKLQKGVDRLRTRPYMPVHRSDEAAKNG